MYAFCFAKTHKVIVGLDMNVFNNFTISFLQKLGASGFVISKEQQKENIKDIENHFVFTLGYAELMTFAHCPYKTISGGTCKTCSYKPGLVYYDVKNNQYKIFRYQMSQCYFKLLHSHLVNNIACTKIKAYVDLNGLTESQAKLALDGLYSGKKVTISNKDIFGKLNHQVK